MIGKTNALILYDIGIELHSSRTHLTYQYGKDDTGSVVFNLFPDYLLKLKVFNPSAFGLQLSWYPQVRSFGGVAVDSELDWTETGLSLWVGAVSNNNTITIIFNDIHGFWVMGSIISLLAISMMFKEKTLESMMSSKPVL